MITAFFICFGVGTGFVVLTMLFGQVFGALDVDFDTGATSPFKPIFIALFLCTFGGLGLMFYRFLDIYLTIIIASLGGLLLTFLLFRFVLIPLKRWQNTNTHEKQSMIGRTAKVTETIQQGGYGKITYTVNEKIVSGPAKSEDGNQIIRGTEVDIVYIEKNTYHVRPKEV
ncbi:MAG: NfeD family protein [Defluviitaleaceae bacterium]|nr:NfeD family protein [Defluviitaleaceae bacterium]